MNRSRPILAFDSGSPRASVAVATAGRVLASRDEPREPGAPDLLNLIDSTLATAGVEPSDLGGVIALAGPGSFTGVRIGCATARAIAQAWEMPACGYSTLAALAMASPTSMPEVLAVVDALRGEWFVQRFGAAGDDGLRTALSAPELMRPSPANALDTAGVCGFGVHRFAACLGKPVETHVPAALAAFVARAASRSSEWSWDLSWLSHPLHLRAPATTRPRT